MMCEARSNHKEIGEAPNMITYAYVPQYFHRSAPCASAFPTRGLEGRWIGSFGPFASQWPFQW